ncbi:hypothetical protein CGLO_04653 [Colletotrichum gloeosporioides Cg-14]|uniref:Uncharacterized protein n=1 Tax=Colletotrichum gloeosporioides (strain Cg-14) TaxID=1237896 RepID=T0KTG7_COLGC|nr:hypothetical protein CGLO_04653 [Colletotrichum gloeosporioides Cg-14]
MNAFGKNARAKCGTAAGNVVFFSPYFATQKTPGKLLPKTAVQASAILF